MNNIPVYYVSNDKHISLYKLSLKGRFRMIRKFIFTSVLVLGLVLGLIFSSGISMEMADEVFPWGQEKI
jgi:hypothetical protein